MPKLFLLFNHTLTAAQEADARQALAVSHIIEPQGEISARWAGVPPAADSLGGWLAPVFSWLADNADPGDFVLIQGEFGATWLAVHRAFALGLIPVYSTTDRQAIEEHLPDGSVHIRHIFQHIRYRRYEPQPSYDEDTP